MDNKFVPKKLEYTASTWGPLLWRSRLLPEIVEEFSRRAALVRGVDELNAETELAALMHDEWQYTPEDHDWSQEVLNPWVQTYMKAFAQYAEHEYCPVPWSLKAIWVNFQHQNEVNLLHNHSGSLSFVLYLDVPEEIVEESHEYKNRGGKPGMIQFVHGSGGALYNNKKQYMPEKGDIFLFPSSLEHMVIPFKSPVERVSVAGNIILADTENSSYQQYY